MDVRALPFWGGYLLGFDFPALYCWVGGAAAGLPFGVLPATRRGLAAGFVTSATTFTALLALAVWVEKPAPAMRVFVEPRVSEVEINWI